MTSEPVEPRVSERVNDEVQGVEAGAPEATGIHMSPVGQPGTGLGVQLKPIGQPGTDTAPMLKTVVVAAPGSKSTVTVRAEDKVRVQVDVAMESQPFQE